MTETNSPPATAQAALGQRTDGPAPTRLRNGRPPDSATADTAVVDELTLVRAIQEDS